MIKMKLQKQGTKEIIFKLNVKEKDILKYPLLKRPIMEGKKIEGIYNYEVPLRYFIPIANNIKKENIKLDPKGVSEFLEFWDEFEEKHFYSLTATPKFMKIWRMENCPDIFKITIDFQSLEITKKVAFKKIHIDLNLQKG